MNLYLHGIAGARFPVKSGVGETTDHGHVAVYQRLRSAAVGTHRHR